MLDLFIANEKVEFRHQNPVAFWLLNRKTFKCFLCALLTSWQMRSHCHPLFLIATIFRNHIICFIVKSLPSNQKAKPNEAPFPGLSCFFVCTTGAIQSNRLKTSVIHISIYKICTECSFGCWMWYRTNFVYLQ